LFEQAIDDRLEYECEHDDAGNAYSHMPREGGWQYNEGDSRLKAWLKKNELTIPEDFESFVDEVLDWCNINPGHQFSNPEMNGDFVVDSYPVGEVEEQYSLKDLASLLDTDTSTAKEFAEMAVKNGFSLNHSRYGGVYYTCTATDAVWNFTIDVEWAKDRITQE
jgi:hypothetical protein